MRRGPLILCTLLGIGCGEPQGPTNAEVDALLQRLDAMSRRLDAVEEALERGDVEGASQRLPLAAFPEPPLEPPADAIPSEPRTLRVDLSRAGVSIDDHVLTPEDAARRFREVAAEHPDTRLVLLAEPDVEHADVLEVLDLASEAGLRDVAMSVRVHGEGEE